MSDKVLRVGCYGAKGSYTYEAMEQQFGNRKREESYFPLFEDVVKAVQEGDIDYGVVPIENSSTGGITEVYDLIQRYGCAVVGEQIVKIEHNLLGLPGAKLEDIDTVFSHPQGFAQCRPFFNKHRDWTLKPYFSTSRSAEKVAQDGKKNQAAAPPPVSTACRCWRKIFSSTPATTPVSSLSGRKWKSSQTLIKSPWSFPCATNRGPSTMYWATSSTAA